MTDVMQFEFEYRREDETFRNSRVMRRAGSATDIFRSKHGLVAIATAIPLGLMLVNGVISLSTAVLMIVIVAYMTRMLWAGKRINDDDQSPLFGRKTCFIDDQGITVDSPNLKLWVNWASVRDIEESPKHIAIYYDIVRAIVLPKASFKSEQDLAALRDTLRKHASVSRIGKSPDHNDPISRTPSNRRSTGWVIFLVLMIWIVSMNLMTVNNSITRAPDVTITIDDTKVIDNSIVLLGKVHNPSKDDWSVSMMEVLFYDANNKFIDQCDVYSGMLLVKAGETTNLKASCGLPVKGDANRIGTIMPDTIKHFSRVEVKAKGGYKSGLMSIFW